MIIYICRVALRQACSGLLAGICIAPVAISLAENQAGIQVVEIKGNTARVLEQAKKATRHRI